MTRALGVLSNPAPWTIAAMFIVMGALVRTGALDRLIKAAEEAAKVQPQTRHGDACWAFCHAPRPS
jgi:hypothetical protein